MRNKRKRRGVLNELKRTEEYRVLYKALLKKLLDYYALNDLEKDTNNRDIFMDLFVKDKSNLLVALDNNVSESTVGRCTVRFNAFALKIIKTDSEFRDLNAYLHRNNPKGKRR